MALQGKTALITGGTSGMGAATALSMAEKGASVIITGRDETRGASAVEQIRAGEHDARFIAADLSEMSEVGHVADAAGEIDVLVNLAGVAAMGPTVARVMRPEASEMARPLMMRTMRSLLTAMLSACRTFGLSSGLIVVLIVT